MHPSPGVKRTFPHIPICGTKFPGVQQEAGVVLLVAFSGRSPPNGAPFIGAEHLVYSGTVLVSQGGRGCVTILLGICRESEVLFFPLLFTICTIKAVKHFKSHQYLVNEEPWPPTLIMYRSVWSM